MNTHKTFAAIAASILTLMAFSAEAQANPRVVAPGEKWAGHSYPELASAWTNWLVLEPIATNPAFDPDGSFCGLNQEGDVWFLASTFGGVADRTCEIPAGKGIFLSLGGVFVSFAPEFPSQGDPCLALGSTVEQVRCDVNNDVPVAPNVAFSVTIDGRPLEDLTAFRAQSEPGGFTLRVPDPSFLTDLGLPAGNRHPAVADGYFLFLKPLRPGTHSLQLRMTNPDQSVLGVNYTLIIP
ncbi:MAG: hypothetical protein U0002_19695 [Thermoanaerobaculia bacterium]